MIGQEQRKPPHKPSVIERIIAVLVAALALQQGYQGALGLRERHDPRLVTLGYGIVLVTGLIAAYALWRGLDWGPGALGLNGFLTAVFVVSLGPLLGIPPEGRSGLWIGGGVILLLTAAGFWYTQRRVRVAPSPNA
jgi:hypothetical protein